MGGNIHIYDRPRQPATRWVDVVGLPGGRAKRIVVRNSAHRLLPTSCCHRRRPAKNLDVKAFYDGVYAYCRAGKGCNVRRSRRRVTARRLAREFKRGLSFIGLARKYGMTSLQVQSRVRRWWGRMRP